MTSQQNKMQTTTIQEAMNTVVNVNPIKFFNGMTVHIDIVLDNLRLTVLFAGFPDGTVTIKGDFPRASSMSAKLPLEHYDCMVCYHQACIQMLPQGITMVINDYPVAKEKHRKDLEKQNI